MAGAYTTRPTAVTRIEDEVSCVSKSHQRRICNIGEKKKEKKKERENATTNQKLDHQVIRRPSLACGHPLTQGTPKPVLKKSTSGRNHLLGSCLHLGRNIESPPPQYLDPHLLAHLLVTYKSRSHVDGGLESGIENARGTVG